MAAARENAYSTLVKAISTSFISADSTSLNYLAQVLLRETTADDTAGVAIGTKYSTAHHHIVTC